MRRAGTYEKYTCLAYRAFKVHYNHRRRGQEDYLSRSLRGVEEPGSLRDVGSKRRTGIPKAISLSLSLSRGSAYASCVLAILSSRCLTGIAFRAVKNANVLVVKQVPRRRTYSPVAVA